MMRPMLSLAAVVLVVLTCGVSASVEAAAFADVSCGAPPATGGVPTLIRLERATVTTGPFTPLVAMPFPVPAPGVLVDAVPAGLASVVYRCSYGNAAGFGVAGPVSDPTIVVQLPGTPASKPTIIIRFQ